MMIFLCLAQVKKKKSSDLRLVAGVLWVVDLRHVFRDGRRVFWGFFSDLCFFFLLFLGVCLVF